MHKIIYKLKLQKIEKNKKVKLMKHRIDIILPDNSRFYIPLDRGITGTELVDFINNVYYNDFVICRNNEEFPIYDVIYSKNESKVPLSEGVKPNFINNLLSDYYIYNRLASNHIQRMPLFVFNLDEYIENTKLIDNNIPVSSFIRKHPKLKLVVKMPTDLVITVETKASKTIKSVQKQLYEQLLALYGEENIRDSKSYRFGTIKGVYPSKKLKFSESPEMMESLTLQQHDLTIPHFLYQQVIAETDFTKASRQYTHDLDLKKIINTHEVLCFNSAFSNLRQNVEKARTERLINDPLLARMRINASEPPLTTCKKQNVPIRVDTRLVTGDSNTIAVSIAISLNTTAHEAIKMIIHKLKVQHTIDCNYDPDNYALVLQGADEIIAGDTPIKNFVCVRQFLLSVSQLFNCLLVDKHQLINQIKEKELSYTALPEAKPEQQYKPILYSKNDQPSFDLRGGFPHSMAKENVSIFIGGCFNIPQDLCANIYIMRVVVLHGANEISAPVLSKPAVGGTSVIWNEVLNVSLQVMQLPRAARIAITLLNFDKVGTSKAAVATINIPVFNFDGWFNSGLCMRSMWNGKDTDPLLTTCQCELDTATRIYFGTPQWFYPIVYIEENRTRSMQTIRVNTKQKGLLDNLVLKKLDPLAKLSHEDKINLFKYRYELVNIPEMLPLVINSIDYLVTNQVLEVPMLLQRWSTPPPTVALTLLDSCFPDHRVREYAVHCLESLTDDEIMLYMLQLVQALKYEMYDDSPLCNFLFRRGLNEPKFLGHCLFWQLMSEAHVSHIRRRFASFVVNFLYGIGIYRDELIKGHKFTQELVKLNHVLSNLSSSEATEPFRWALKKFDLPNEFHLPMDPRLIVDSFVVEKCKVMNSKKKPFWLTFHNAAPFASENISVLFKVGDDLRQDQLTLQVMRVMEHLWMREGFDLHMRCYAVLPTGFNQGFIEVVPNAITEQALQQERGTFAGVWDVNTINDYLVKVNVAPQNQSQARSNFMYSSAGYAVATCVLGIADRHPGNIMLQNDGHFLHIDFGHFLGNFKTKLGYQRENAPFHFSPACARVLGDVDSEMFNEFRNLCGKALNILRHNTNLLVALFTLMLGTGIPELQNPEDIRYMIDMLFLDKTDEEAKLEFDRLTNLSLDSTRTKLNNLFHNIAVS